MLRRKLSTAGGVRVRVRMKVTANKSINIVKDIRTGAFAPELIQDLRVVQSTMSNADEIINLDGTRFDHTSVDTSDLPEEAVEEAEKEAEAMGPATDNGSDTSGSTGSGSGSGSHGAGESDIVQHEEITDADGHITTEDVHSDGSVDVTDASGHTTHTEASTNSDCLLYTSPSPRD